MGSGEGGGGEGVCAGCIDDETGSVGVSGGSGRETASGVGGSGEGGVAVAKVPSAAEEVVETTPVAVFAAGTAAGTMTGTSDARTSEGAVALMKTPAAALAVRTVDMGTAVAGVVLAARLLGGPQRARRHQILSSRPCQRRAP